MTSFPYTITKQHNSRDFKIYAPCNLHIQSFIDNTIVVAWDLALKPRKHALNLHNILAWAYVWLRAY